MICIAALCSSCQTHCDHDGGIVAATDSDIVWGTTITDAYIWPRDARWWPMPWTAPDCTTWRTASSPSPANPYQRRFFHPQVTPALAGAVVYPVGAHRRAASIQETRPRLGGGSCAHYERTRDLYFIRASL